MRMTIRCAAVFVATLAGHALGQANSLSDDAARLVGARKLARARVGISLRDTQNATVLADYHAGETFTPASNMKLLTSGAALLVLTPDFQFRTEFVLDGERLVIKGSGDPALADPEVLELMSPRMSVDDVLAVLTGAVSKAGVTQLTEVVADDRVFDRQFVHPSWPEEKLDRGYSAQVAGINFHANVVLAYPRPSPDGPGRTPTFTMSPSAPWLMVENKARTVADGKNTPWLSREPLSNRFTLRGDIRFSTQVGAEITVHNAPEFFALVLADHLRRAGVKITSGDGGRVVGSGEAAAQGRVLAAVSTPIAEVLHRCNSDSANLYAEALLKRMGHAITGEPGSWANGAAVMRMVLAERLGPQAAAGLTIADGSGLSRDNAVSPGVLTRWLEFMAKSESTRDVFTESLAVPGKGTLKKRFAGQRLENKVYAKSGFINGVRTLSGYVVDQGSGRRVAFSVMVNDIKTDTQTQATIELHEDIVKLADKWLTQRAERETPKSGG